MMAKSLCTLFTLLLWGIPLLASSTPTLSLASSGSLANSPRVSLRESVFREVEDYAAWTQYLCSLLLRANDMDRLEEAVYRLHQLIQQMDRSKRAPVQRAYDRFISIINRRREKNPWLHQPVDPVADAIFKALMEGHFEQAKKEIREIVGGSDYREMTEPMKTVMIVEGLVLLDGLNAFTMLPLWKPAWKLSKDEMIAAIMRAKDLTVAARQGELDPTTRPAYHPFPQLSKVDARVMANLGRQVMATGNATEDALLTAAVRHAKQKYCSAQKTLKQAGGDKASLRTLINRLDEQCQADRLDKTYHAFCQVGRTGLFPIAEALQRLPEASTVARHERMFWTRIWVGDCRGAALDMRQILTHLPRGLVRRRGYLRRRIQFMRDRLRLCRETPGLYCSADARQMMRSIVRKDLPAAEAAWKRAFSANPRHPLAQLWRTAIMITKYPKSIYSPCTGNSLLSGDPAMDARIFDRVSVLAHGRTVRPCWTSDREERVQCEVLWMKAAYIVGKYNMVVEYANRLERRAGHCNEGHQLVACVHLCGLDEVPQEACTALSSYSRMCPRTAALPHNKIGLDLAERMCQGRREAILDPFFIRHGLTSQPMLRLFHHYFPGFVHVRQTADISIRSLLCGEASPSSTPPMHPEINLPTPQKKQALWQAHKTLCPCMQMTDLLRQKIIEKHVNVQNQATRRTQLLSLRYPDPCPCHCPCPCDQSSKTIHRPAPQPHPKPVHFTQHHLLLSGALRAAAQMYSQGHMKCPCLQEKIITQHHLVSKAGKDHCTCCCPCEQGKMLSTVTGQIAQKVHQERMLQQKQQLEERQLALLNQLRRQDEERKQKLQQEQQLRIQRLRQEQQLRIQRLQQEQQLRTQRLRQEHQMVQKRLAQERRRLHQLQTGRPTYQVPGVGAIYPHQMHHVACHLNMHCPCHCSQMLMRRFPFLQRYMLQNRTKMPCKQMSMQLRKVLCAMIKQVEAGCEATLAQNGLSCDDAKRAQ